MTDALKRIWNVFTSAVVLFVLILAILLAGVRVFGLQVFAVLSGSMEPAYKTGALIYVRALENPWAIPEGTAITYMADENTVVTHRIVGTVVDENDPSVVRYRTKGDANNVEDGTLVHYRNVIGTPVFSIPGLGYLANFIQHPPGSYISISFAAVFALLLFLPELVKLLRAEGTASEPAQVQPKKKRRNKGGAHCK